MMITQWLSSYGLETGMWLSLVFYLVCFFPQIWTNYQNKSGKGISELMLLGYLNAYVCLLYYIFSLDMPLAYRIMVPLHATCTVILVLQRLYYDTSSEGIMMRLVYAGNIGLALLILPFACRYPFLVGSLCGWGSFILSVVNQLPQVAKIFKDRSVAGFSLLFVIFTGIAALLETVVAYAAGLPAQTQYNAVRGVVIAILFCIQFLLYGKK